MRLTLFIPGDQRSGTEKISILGLLFQGFHEATFRILSPSSSTTPLHILQLRRIRPGMHLLRLSDRWMCIDMDCGARRRRAHAVRNISFCTKVARDVIRTAELGSFFGSKHLWVTS